MNETITSPLLEEGGAVVTMGAKLRDARVAKNLSIADVAGQIRLAPRQIEALEADDFTQLPELPFVRGFVRSYAKLLQLDDQPLLATLPSPHMLSERIEPVSVDVPFNITQLSKQQNKVWLIASAVIAVFAIVFALWHFSTPKVEKTVDVVKSEVLESSIVLPEQSVANSAVLTSEIQTIAISSVASNVVSTVSMVLPVSAVAPASLVLPVSKVLNNPVQSAVQVVPVAVMPISSAESAVVANASKLRLVFDAESWTEVRDATGKILSSKLNVAGSELNVNGVAPYDLVIGHAQSVHLYRRGKLVELNSHINTGNEVARLTLE